MARIIYPTLQAPVLTQAQEPEQVTESRWHQAWSDPVRVKIAPGLAIALIAASGNSFNPLPLPNAFPFADKYWNRFEDPVRLKPGLRTNLQQTLALVEAAPFTETTTESRWHQPWSEPSVKEKRGLKPSAQQFTALVQAAPFNERIFADKWIYPWSEPVRQKPGLAAPLQLTAVWLFYEQPQVDKWIYPYTDPVRIKPGLNAALQAAFPAYAEAAPFPEDVTESRWHAPWSEPVRIKPRLLEASQPVVAFTYFPGPPLDAWIYAWSDPVRLPIGLKAQLQMTLPAQTIVPQFASTRITLKNEMRRVRLLSS